MAATAHASKGEKEPVNIVHQNAIFRETIKKEQRNQKLYTDYSVNPFKKSRHSFRSMTVMIKIHHFFIIPQTLFHLIQCMCWQANPTQHMTQQMEWKMVRKGLRKILFITVA